MDKDQLHTLLSSLSTSDFSLTTYAGIETLAKEFPYFSALQFANYASQKALHKQTDTSKQREIAQLAIYKSNPYLFAAFIKSMEKMEAPAVQKETISATNTEKEEDILSLINELPNTNPIPKPREEQIIFTATDRSRFAVNLEKEEDKSLMVMMSFTDWLFHFKNKTEKDRQEEKDKKALKTAWQKEKLAAATEEENEEIPEEIFKQAMESISENSIISESLALILAKQGKTDRAIDMYKKLSLRNPEKNSYFADRIKELLTNKDF